LYPVDLKFEATIIMWTLEGKTCHRVKKDVFNQIFQTGNRKNIQDIYA
jgi:hypothetical protein